MSGVHRARPSYSPDSGASVIFVQLPLAYKNIDVFYIDPLSDLRPDLEASGCRDFEDVTSFTKVQILAEI